MSEEREAILIPTTEQVDTVEYDTDYYYDANGIEFSLDELLNDFKQFCRYMFRLAGFEEPTTLQIMIIDFLIKPSKKDKMIQAPRGT